MLRNQGFIIITDNLFFLIKIGSIELKTKNYNENK